MYQIFVFGTLKQGFPNFDHNSGLRVTGAFETRERYPLYLVGERFTPWMMDSPGQGHPVRGEVYAVDDNGLAQMDRLERVGLPDGYIRRTIPVTDKARGQQHMVMVYLKQPVLLDPASIQEGPLAEYTLAHAARYRRRPDDAAC